MFFVVRGAFLSSLFCLGREEKCLGFHLYNPLRPVSSAWRGVVGSTRRLLLVWFGEWWWLWYMDGRRGIPIRISEDIPAEKYND